MPKRPPFPGASASFFPIAALLPERQVGTCHSAVPPESRDREARQSLPGADLQSCRPFGVPGVLPVKTRSGVPRRAFRHRSLIDKPCFLCASKEDTVEVPFKDPTFSGVVCKEHLFQLLKRRPGLPTAVAEDNALFGHVSPENLNPFVGKIDDPWTLLALGVFLGNHTNGVLEVNVGGLKNLGFMRSATCFPREFKEVSETLILDLRKQDGKVFRRDELVSTRDFGTLDGRECVAGHVPSLDGPIHAPFEGRNLRSLPPLVGPVFKMSRLGVPQTEGRVLRNEGLEQIFVPPVGPWASVGLCPPREAV